MSDNLAAYGILQGLFRLAITLLIIGVFLGLIIAGLVWLVLHSMF